MPKQSPLSNQFEEILVEQGSEEWHEIRLPLVTGSEFKSVLAKTKAGLSKIKAGQPITEKEEAAARRNYRAELVVQRLTGQVVERYRTRSMGWGNETEDLAALAYSLKTGNMVEKCGIFVHKERQIGVSPDRRIIGQKGGLEIKCYELANHILCLRTNHMPPEHRAQVMGEIWAGDWDFVDFVSFAPELPGNAQLFTERIYRDDLKIKELSDELEIFEKEVDDEVKFIANYGKKVTA